MLKTTPTFIELLDQKYEHLIECIAADIQWQLRRTYTGERWFWLPRIAEWVLPSELKLGPEFWPDISKATWPVWIGRNLGGAVSIPYEKFAIDKAYEDCARDPVTPDLHGKTTELFRKAEEIKLRKLKEESDG